MTKTSHPTTITIIADGADVGKTVGDVGDSVGNDVGAKEGERVGNDSVGNEVGAMEYSQLQAIQEEP